MALDGAKRNVYLIAGEPSGDLLGGQLMAALRARAPDMMFSGIGGEAMAAQGLDTLFPMSDLTAMGFFEVLPRLPHLRTRLSETVADIAARHPDVVVTIDSPGFALRVLKAIRTLDIKRVHYVAPQVWAWRENRVKHYHELWHELLCLLPFEPPFFNNHNLRATFVGHPVLESGADCGNAARFRATYHIAQEARVITLMPGSRRTEVRRLLPILGATLQLMPNLVPVIPVSASVADSVYEGTQNWASRPVLVVTPQDKFDAFAASAAAITKSGTSTLELALAGVPMLVTYRVNPLSAAVARRLIKVKHVSLLNLLTGQEMVPELLQEACTPQRLAGALQTLLDDPEAAAAQRSAYPAALAMLRPLIASPSETAAAVLMDLLAGRQSDELTDYSKHR
jgi:lipid-A-disaccharide synthase